MAKNDLENGRVAVYRAFDDQNNLLYVGISKNPRRRIYAEHRKGSVWYKDVARFDVRVFENRQIALNVEAAAIISEAPRHLPWFEARDLLPDFCEPEPIERFDVSIDRSGLFD